MGKMKQWGLPLLVDKRNSTLIHYTVEKYKIARYTLCIMGNHYHLLLTTPYEELTKAMHYVGSTYGSFLRRQKGWIGHVFAGRYKSLCAEKEGYLLELSRYIPAILGERR